MSNLEKKYPDGYSIKWRQNNDPEPERYYDWMLWKMRQLEQNENSR